MQTTVETPQAAASDIAAAIHPDGFIDFYELLGLPGNASDELVSDRIRDLYLTAQTNREHRHADKRRESEFLIELLPHALNVLGNAENRTRYNNYAATVRAGTAPMDFEEFMNSSIKGTHETESRKGQLGLREEPVAAPRPAPAAAKASAATPTARAASAAPTPVGAPMREVGAPGRPSIGLPIGAAILTFVFSDMVLHAPSAVSIGATVLVGGALWKVLDAGWRAKQVKIDG